MSSPAERINASPKLNDFRKRRIVVLIDRCLRPFRWVFRLAGPSISHAPGTPRRILLIRMDGIGDLMMSTAIFPALRQRYPQARIDLLCSTLVLPLAKLLVASGQVDRLHLLPLTGVGLGMWRKMIAQLRRGHYDIAADLRGDFRNLALAYLSGAPRRIGLAYSGLDFLATETLPFEQVHTAEEVARVAERLGVPNAPRQPRLDLPGDVQQWAEDWLGKAGLNQPGDARTGRRPLIALHLSAGQPARIWPLPNFISVCRELEKSHAARFVVIGAPGVDEALGRQLKEALGSSVVIAAGRANLPRTAAIVARCDLFIGTDSGPAHIAAAVGCPVVVFFGPGNETVMRPYARHLRIVRAKHSCDPRCANKTCAIPDRHCLATIRPDEVTTAAEALLAPPSVVATATS